MTPTNEPQSPRNLLLRIGYEGGLVEVYTQSLESLAPVWRESNEMSFDDNDDEIWVDNRIEYADFNAYWQEFTDRELWFCGKPMLIHPAIHTYVQKTLDQVRTQPHPAGQNAPGTLPDGKECWKPVTYLSKEKLTAY